MSVRYAHFKAISLDYGAKVLQTAGVTRDLAEYFRELTRERSVRAIAIRAGLDESTVKRQLAGTSRLTIELVVAICRAYELDFATVFVAVGWLTEEEVATFARRFALSQLTDREISKEIIRRLDAGDATEEITEPISSDVIQEVLDEKHPVKPEDEIPYIGRVDHDGLPERRAADKKPRKGDQDHAE